MTSEPPLLLRYFDVALLLVAAPVLLLIGVPAAGYGIAAGAWIALRALGIPLEHGMGTAASDPRREISVRLGYMLGRLFALAVMIVLVRRDIGKDDGLTALAVVVVAFTVQLTLSAINRPRKR
jgi:hypothetical protein